MKTVTLIIHIHGRNWNSRAFICFLFKKCKSCVRVSIVKVPCLRISTRLDLMNNNHVTRSTLFTFTPLAYLFHIVIENQITSCLVKILFVGAVWCIGQGGPYQILVLPVQVWSTLSEQLCACCISTHVASVLWYTEIQRHTMYFRVKLCPLAFWTVPTVMILIFNYYFSKRFICYTKSVIQFNRIFVGTLRIFKIICF